MTLTPHRRDLLKTAAAAAGAALGLARPALAAPAPRLGPPQPFSYEALKQRAAALAAKPYAPPVVAEAALLEAIDYDAYGQIAYRPEMTLWGDTPGAQGVRLFPLGRYFKQAVAIHRVEGGQAREVLYGPELFDTPAGHPLRRLKAGGFAGFRLLNPDRRSDWMAFLGASYFRSSGPHDQYGASARGLALNSGGPAAEEFPHFSAFWLEQDGSGGLNVYALLESPSVAGAYRITNRQTPAGPVQEIEAALTFRAPVETLGLAPLTSMYWYGENTREPKADWRPEVHDSDGLAIATGGGERIWRPLVNPARATTNAFLDTDPKGFGLIQRDRTFDHYQDDGVFYDKRASLWVEPLSGWGKGEVRLVELSTAGETDDNVVAFWTPAGKIQAGSRFDVRYRLNWRDDAPEATGAPRIVATRTGLGGRPGLAPTPGSRKFVVDVEGPALRGLSRDSGVEVSVQTSRGRIESAAAYPVVGTAGWRMMFDVVATGPQPVDLRAYLKRGSTALSETWIYQYAPS